VIDPSEPQLSMRQLVVMRSFSLLGMVLMAIGLIGLWVPVLPTTVFMIGAAACFARSSPRLYAYITEHRTFGPPLRQWFEEGAISKAGKAAALFGMGLGMFLVIVLTRSSTWISFAAIIMLASGWYVMSRPLPAREKAADEASRLAPDEEPPVPPSTLQ
jgi:hypothetical protein